MGADKLRHDPAAVDIAHKDHRHIRRLGKAHIGDVAGAEVDLGRAACAFDDDQIAPCGEAVKALEHLGHQGRLQLAIVPRLERGEALPLHDHLRADIGLGLEEHGVHIDERLEPRRPRLKRLRAADLATIGGHGGVVRHILRLERRNPEAAPHIGPRQPRDDKRFADVRARALDHDRLGHRHLRPWF